MDSLSASFGKFDEICRRRGPSEPGTQNQSEQLREFAETASLLKRKANLAHQAVSLPRNIPARDAKELRDLHDNIAREQERWVDSLWASISRLRKRNNSLADSVRISANDDALLNKLVLNLEREISIFKERQRQVYDELALEQSSLEDALQHMEQRFNNWVTETYTEKEPKQQAAAAAHTPAKPKFEDARLSKIRTAIDAVQSEIDRNGGEFGNWTKEDHETFCRLYTKHNMSQDKAGTLFYKTAAHLLPLMSHENLVDHVNWFVTYDERRLQKKNLLAEWRERKDQLRSAQAEEVTQQTLAAELETKRKREKQQQKNAEEMKRKIADWKQAKAEEIKRLEIREAREQAERKRAEQEQIALEQAKRKPIVKAFVEQRKRQQAAFQPQARAELPPEVKERIANRNHELYLKNMKLQQAREREAQPTPLTPKSSYAYVKSRVFDQTESYMQKLRLNENESQDAADALGSKYTKVAGNWAHQGVNSMRPAIRTPSWRKAN